MSNLPAFVDGDGRAQTLADRHQITEMSAIERVRWELGWDAAMVEARAALAAANERWNAEVNENSRLCSEFSRQLAERDSALAAAEKDRDAWERRWSEMEESENAIREQLAESEAGAAAMREALQRIADAASVRPYYLYSHTSQLKRLQELLATSPGRAVLDELERLRGEVERLTPHCAVCGKPASCFGRYETEGSIEFQCDSCCGHGKEDGWCAALSFANLLTAANDAEDFFERRRAEARDGYAARWKALAKRLHIRTRSACDFCDLNADTFRVIRMITDPYARSVPFLDDAVKVSIAAEKHRADELQERVRELTEALQAMVDWQAIRHEYGCPNKSKCFGCHLDDQVSAALGTQAGGDAK